MGRSRPLCAGTSWGFAAARCEGMGERVPLPGESGVSFGVFFETFGRVIRDVGFPVLVAAYLLWQLGPKVDALVSSSQAVERELRALTARGCFQPGSCGSLPRPRLLHRTGGVASVGPAPVLPEDIASSCGAAASGAFRSLGLRCAK